ncbi:hypothetical protein [Hoeflea sp.]|uniref:hypothetical protein n=1 Tax=Hoeflea sp. TaxID=1940281 RepID=UPI0019BCBD10|nr:hypothetical protein [Hoeflea sp.]MBC7284275.1 hypothetical protein [Hoeflea sp.]
MTHVYLHIGIGKTGTTAIQHALHLQRDQLLEDGVLYPKSGVAYEAHHSLAPLNVKAIPKPVKEMYETLRSEIEEANPDKVLLSSEFFCFVNPNVVAEIAAYMKDYTTTVIFFVREQVDLIESAYKQELKTNPVFTSTFDEYIQRVVKAFDFNERINPWVENFGRENVKALLYRSKKGYRSDPLKLLLDETDILLSADTDLSELNPSIPSCLAETVRLVNKTGISHDDKRAIVQEIMKSYPLIGPGRKEGLVSPRMAKFLRKRYEDSNKSFGDKYLDEKDAADLMSG